MYVLVCVCMRGRDVARCRTVVSICRTVIIDCRIPRDGATLRALNTARGVPRSCTTHTKRTRCRYASVISLTSATASPISLSPSLSVTRLFARVSDPAPTRSTVRSLRAPPPPPPPPPALPLPLRLRPISKIAFSSRPVREFVTSQSIHRQVYRSDRIYRKALPDFFIHPLTALVPIRLVRAASLLYSR